MWGSKDSRMGCATLVQFASIEFDDSDCYARAFRKGREREFRCRRRLGMMGSRYLF
jgi:hypothetical protein